MAKVWLALPFQTDYYKVLHLLRIDQTNFTKFEPHTDGKFHFGVIEIASFTMQAVGCFSSIFLKIVSNPN